MKRTKKNDTAYAMTVDLITLAYKLGCGQATAKTIGEKAGARIQIGRRVLYKLDTVNTYLDAEAASQNKTTKE